MSESIIDFVARQNAILRTGNLYNPEIEPIDVPLSSYEAKYFEEEERKYQEIINNLHKQESNN